MGSQRPGWRHHRGRGISRRRRGLSPRPSPPGPVPRGHHGPGSEPDPSESATRTFASFRLWPARPRPPSPRPTSPPARPAWPSCGTRPTGAIAIRSSTAPTAARATRSSTPSPTTGCAPPCGVFPSAATAGRVRGDPRSPLPRGTDRLPRVRTARLADRSRRGADRHGRPDRGSGAAGWPPGRSSPSRGSAGSISPAIPPMPTAVARLRARKGTAGQAARGHGARSGGDQVVRARLGGRSRAAAPLAPADRVARAAVRDRGGPGIR